MDDSVLIDNDVILKACCYNAVQELIDGISGASRTVYALGVARFVLSRAISKAKNIANKQRAGDCLAFLLRCVEPVEPDSAEIQFAAELEEMAQAHCLALDGGESQLLAVLVNRSFAFLFTGDKRAIRAIEAVVSMCGLSEFAAGKVACIEQIVLTLVTRHGSEEIKRRVCSESAIDQALAICFSCASGISDHSSILHGLTSYIADLRRSAPTVLVEFDDLSTVIS